LGHKSAVKGFIASSAFYRWKLYTSTPDALEPPKPPDFVAYAWATETWGHTTAPLRRFLKEDRQLYLDDILNQTQENLVKGDLERAYSMLRLLKPFSASPVPNLIKNDGSVAATAEEVANEWARHYTTRHAGRLVDQQDITAEAIGFHDAVDDCPREIEAVPTLTTVTKLFRRTKPRKAMGEDQLPPEIFACLSDECAAIFWPIMVEAFLRCYEPVAWRGATSPSIRSRAK